MRSDQRTRNEIIDMLNRISNQLSECVHDISTEGFLVAYTLGVCVTEIELICTVLTNEENNYNQLHGS